MVATVAATATVAGGSSGWRSSLPTVVATTTVAATAATMTVAATATVVAMTGHAAPVAAVAAPPAPHGADGAGERTRAERLGGPRAI